MAPASSRPAVGGSCREEESLQRVCSCGSSSINAAEDEAAAGDVSASSVLTGETAATFQNKSPGVRLRSSQVKHPK